MLTLPLVPLSKPVGPVLKSNQFSVAVCSEKLLPKFQFANNFRLPSDAAFPQHCTEAASMYRVGCAFFHLRKKATEKKVGLSAVSFMP